MNHRDHLYVFLLSVLFFVPFLGSVHLFDWDEINFAESAREMLLTGNWFQVQINFEPFWEKPPLFFWMQAGSMKLFGVNEFAARFPNAIAGILTLQALFSIGRRWHSNRFAWLWVLLYLGSFLPHLYFRSGIIDPWFNLFIFLSIYHLFLVLEHGDRNATKNAIIAGLFSGAAVLTKGPVGILLLLLTLLVWLVVKRFRVRFPWRQAAWFSLTAFLVTTLWFGYETLANGPWFLVEFLAYQIDLLLHPVAGHAQPFYYHFAVVLLGCFPLSVFALPSFFGGQQNEQSQLRRWMKYLFWVVMILFTLVTTKIVHYSSMAYIPLAYLATSYLNERLSNQQMVPFWQRVWIASHGTLIALALLSAPLLIQFKAYWLDWVKDDFARESIEAAADTYGWEWLIGGFYLLLILYCVRLLGQQIQRGIRLLLFGTALTIFMAMLVLVPLVESISQRSAIAFFSSHSGEDVHFETYGYKSYAHYFYGNIDTITAHTMDEHQMHQPKLAVLVSVKVNHIERFNTEYPEATYLSSSGGFYFYRIPPAPIR